MLTREENELLTRVGPGTPMGEALRRYWIPVLVPEEVAERDGDPVRVRVLGEDLVAFRDSDGRVGLLGEFCAHRGTSLFYGRNEECGLRCIYHGWKYDVAGAVLETPNEPMPRAYEGNLRHRAYPTREAGGAIWAYLGPPNRMPELPNLPWVARSKVHAKKVYLECNYLQSIEGGIDSSHVSILHRASIAANQEQLLRADEAPVLELEDMPYGFRYGALRQAPEGKQYVRITPFIMPWYTIVPFPAEAVQAAHAWIPIDDEHNYAFTFNFSYADDVELTPDQWTHQYDMAGRFTKRRRRHNNHLQDRAAMRVDSWSGIPLIPDQDATVQESMRPIYDRSTEHLGRADLAVTHMRALLLASVKAVQERRDPIGVGGGFPMEHIRSEVLVVPADKPWRELGLPAETITAG